MINNTNLFDRKKTIVFLLSHFYNFNGYIITFESMLKDSKNITLNAKLEISTIILAIYIY